MHRAEPVQHSRAVKEIMHERVDCNHAASRRDPTLSAWIANQQQIGEHHRQDLVGNAKDASHWLKQCMPHSDGSATVSRSRIGTFQPPVDPTHQITVADIPNEEEQAVGSLTEAPVAQRMPGQVAAMKQVWFRADPRTLLIFAIREVPVAV